MDIFLQRVCEKGVPCWLPLFTGFKKIYDLNINTLHIFTNFLLKKFAYRFLLLYICVMLYVCVYEGSGVRKKTITLLQTK